MDRGDDGGRRQSSLPRSLHGHLVSAPRAAAPSTSSSSTTNTTNTTTAPTTEREGLEPISTTTTSTTTTAEWDQHAGGIDSGAYASTSGGGRRSRGGEPPFYLSTASFGESGQRERSLPRAGPSSSSGDGYDGRRSSRLSAAYTTEAYSHRPSGVRTNSEPYASSSSTSTAAAGAPQPSSASTTGMGIGSHPHAFTFTYPPPPPPPRLPPVLLPPIVTREPEPGPGPSSSMYRYGEGSHRARAAGGMELPYEPPSRTYEPPRTYSPHEPRTQAPAPALYAPPPPPPYEGRQPRSSSYEGSQMPPGAWYPPESAALNPPSQGYRGYSQSDARRTQLPPLTELGQDPTYAAPRPSAYQQWTLLDALDSRRVSSLFGRDSGRAERLGEGSTERLPPGEDLSGLRQPPPPPPSTYLPPFYTRGESPVGGEESDGRASQAEGAVSTPRRGLRRSFEGEDYEEEEPPPRKVSKKTVIACNFCRGRKLKCDGQRPTCRNCDRRKNVCDYVPVQRRRGPGKAPKGSRKLAKQRAGQGQGQPRESPSTEVNVAGSSGGGTSQQASAYSSTEELRVPGPSTSPEQGRRTSGSSSGAGDRGTPNAEDEEDYFGRYFGDG